MEDKFIGLDGFEEIQNISAVKTEPIPHKNFKKSKPRHASYSRQHEIVKKRAVLAVITSATAVILSCATVASAFGATTDTVPPKTSAAVSSAVSADEPATVPMVFANPITQAKSYGLYVDGELIGITDDREALDGALDKVLTDYREGYDDETTTEFANSVEVKEVDEDDVTLTDADEIVENARDKFSIALATDYIYKDEQEYETIVTYDDSQPASYEKVVTKGQKGITEYTVRVTFTDGLITDSEITGSKQTQELINKEVVKGTASDGSSNESYDSDDTSYVTGGSGWFIWPLPHTHNLTSYFEWRWGRMHNGLDIAGGGDYGMPIVASDSGTVIWSGNDGGGYGNYVMIDHGNGYVTVYGHASSLACSTGDYVAQGQTIAYVGSTGNSTGPHLHFEIRENGTPVNPLNYF